MTSSGELRAAGLIAIVGAGPAGLTLGRLLLTRGFSVRIFERDASSTSRVQGGSLDLRTDSGQKALAEAGLAEAFERVSRSEAKAFKLIDSHGKLQPDAGGDTHENAGPEIDRGDLRQLLLQSLPSQTVDWGHAVSDVVPETDGRWRLEFANQASVTADMVVGADGIGSRVRNRLTSVQPRYTGITMLAANIRRDLWRGSKISDVLGEGSVMFAGGDKTIFVQRCNHDLILLYYSMMVAEDWPAPQGFALDDKAAVLAAVNQAYRDWSPELVAMLTKVEDTFQRWPISVLPPDTRWKTQPGLTMLGDAAHVMPPFTGKGVNLALFDALELADALTADPAAEIAAAVSAFEKQMQDRTRKETGECLGVGQQFYGLNMKCEQRSE